ncbi:MAG: 16S rRNA (guanine(966)-N(2))-methyltransferase RsmD [Candidatus Saganbacteria bacterium]|nr:16S rRNA (guanine(966)-N(2))-methyltransferase RsmD [Candidatus Saganbacteria bacterium]
MRVISGKAKGKKLNSPKGKTRPLSDQVKEALFNILQNRICDCYFLDLFAGSGAVGIEALSRGATLSIFVELDKKTVRVIRENLELCSFSDRAEVYALDVLRALRILKRKGAKFDIIFIGAPYDSPNLEKVLAELSDGSLLNERGIVVAEHRRQHKIQDQYEKLVVFRSVKYGETELTFYESSNLSR